MEWNTLGWIVRNEWLRTPWICPEIELDEFVVMPNHLHAIIVIRTGWEERIPASRVYTRAHGRAPLVLFHGQLVAVLFHADPIQVSSG